MENVLVDMDWKGTPKRKLLLHPGRSGFMYVLDRGTGELLSAEKFVDSTNWASGYDLATGLPQRGSQQAHQAGQVVKDICPSSTGGKEFVPSAFSPLTGLLYIPAHNTCMNYEGLEANYIAGTPYLGADVKMYPGPGGYQGELVAWDPVRGKKVWGIREQKLPLYSGVLATAGNLVFYGTMDGYFRRRRCADRDAALSVSYRLGDRRRSDHLPRPRRQAVRRHLFGRRRLDGGSRLPGRVGRRSRTRRSVSWER